MYYLTYYLTFFKVDGVLMAPDGPDCWPKGDSPQQWLLFYRLNDMTLTGTGTIVGNGEKWWSLPCKPHMVLSFSFPQWPTFFCIHFQAINGA